MSATEDLKEEHQGVRLMLSILENISERLGQRETVDPHHLDQILEFIKVFVDKCHHKKEEGFLFPLLEESVAGKKLVKELLDEHFILHGLVSRIEEGATEYKKGNLKGALKIIDNSKKYIDLLRIHADREDEKLFPLTDKLLDESKQRELEKKFADWEVRQIGSGKHEQFHQMLGNLQKIYL